MPCQSNEKKNNLSGHEVLLPAGRNFFFGFSMVKNETFETTDHATFLRNQRINPLRPLRFLRESVISITIKKDIRHFSCALANGRIAGTLSYTRWEPGYRGEKNNSCKHWHYYSIINVKHFEIWWSWDGFMPTMQEMVRLMDLFHLSRLNPCSTDFVLILGCSDEK